MLDNDYSPIETAEFRWIPTYDLETLEEINLETMEKAFYGISAPKDYTNWFNLICPLPGNKSFCCISNATDIKCTSFIIDEDHKIQPLSTELSTIGYCATYHDNFVYMFGKDSLCRCNLIKRRWEKLSKPPNCVYYFCTCISLDGMIVAAYFDYVYAFVFDLWTNSHSWCSLELEQDSTKILCKSGHAAYLIDFSGSIWESDKSNLYWWNIVGFCKPIYFWSYSNIIFYKNSWYFNIDSVIMKFNLDKKSVCKTNGSISYGNESIWDKEYPLE